MQEILSDQVLMKIFYKKLKIRKLKSSLFLLPLWERSGWGWTI
jgi:hypothetical protein